jgi:hypothetical protein
MTTTVLTPRNPVWRLAFASLAVVLMATAVLLTVRHGSGYWQLAAFGLGPDLALVYGVAPGLERGRLHPRAVRLYNLLHSLWLPVALGVAATAGVVDPGLLVGALAWAFHITLDRSVGYGLRTRDGFQRG